MTASAELLLRALLSVRPDRDRVRALASAPDVFAEAFALAERLQLAAAMHAAVSAHFHDLAPPPIRAVLGAIHAGNLRRNREIRDIARELGAAAAADGLELVLLKGGAWIFDAPEEAAPWRQLADLDLLTRADRIRRTAAALAGLGWNPLEPVSDAPSGYDILFARPGTRVGVEMHHHLLWTPELLPTDLMFAEAEPVASGLLIPAPWCRAVHAILHWRVKDRGRLHYDLIRVAGVWVGGSVRDETLRQALDVARFMDRPDVDWARVRRHAEATGLARDFTAALALAHVLLDAPLPEGFPVPAVAVEQARAQLAARRSVASYHAAWAWAGIRQAWKADSARYPLVWGASRLRIAAAVAATRLYRTPDLVYRVVTLPTFALRAWWRERRRDR